MNIFSELQCIWQHDRDASVLLAERATLRFAELDNRAAAYAGVLRYSLGVHPGDVVLVAVRKSVDAVALYLACLRAGIVYLPANPASTARELTHLAVDAAPRAVIADTGAFAGAEAAARSAGVKHALTLDDRGGGSFGTLARAATPFDATEPCSARTTAALLYTSGTTGAPKGVPLSHGNLLSNAQALLATWRMTPDDLLVHALPIFHVHGLFVALHCALLARTPVRFLRAFEPRTVMHALEGATVFMGVPTFYARLLEQQDFGHPHCRTLRLAISGSAPLSSRLFQAFQSRTGQPILERYGMTETGMIASNPLHGERVAGTVGFALPGVELRIEGAGGGPAPPGTTGMVQVRGPGVFDGYINRPEANASAFTADGYFRTGDIGMLDAQGRLSLSGRASDLIISGGFNLYPAEIESCLDEVPGVAESVVIGIEDADLGERAIAVVVPEDPDKPPAAEALREVLTGQLARYKHPRDFEFVAALPRNAMGKVVRQQLRELYAHRAGDTD